MKRSGPASVARTTPSEHGPAIGRAAMSVVPWTLFRTRSNRQSKTENDISPTRSPTAPDVRSTRTPKSRPEAGSFWVPFHVPTRPSGSRAAAGPGGAACPPGR